MFTDNQSSRRSRVRLSVVWLGAVPVWLLAVPVVGRAQAVYDVVAAFDAPLDHGMRPYAELIQGSDGSFYGTRRLGGVWGQGTVFRLDTAGTLTTLHMFSGSDGVYPYAGLIQGTDGSFYGTTSGGGAFGYGTVFKLDTAGTLTTLHSFEEASDGAFPEGLIQGGDGNFYGTTSGGVRPPAAARSSG